MERANTPARGRERRSPTPAAARKRAAIRALKAALAEDRIVLHYQPMVAAAGARVESVEALMRWRKPKVEPRALADLIVSAERSPVIFRLENWVLEQSLPAAAGWRRDGLPSLDVHVNLSAREFPRADLVARLERRLAKAGLSPEGLGLEITETSAIGNFADVADQIDRLMAMGVELWLDDFGTGHSSLEWLSHLPLHGVKIAGTFVERLHSDVRCRAIVARVIGLAHDLGLRVIAEGVETPAQRDYLVEQGCDSLQGFLFYAPMSAEELPDVLAEAP